MYCWPYHLKVWQGHGPTGPTDSALHEVNNLGFHTFNYKKDKYKNAKVKGKSQSNSFNFKV